MKNDFLERFFDRFENNVLRDIRVMLEIDPQAYDVPEQQNRYLDFIDKFPVLVPEPSRKSNNIRKLFVPAVILLCNIIDCLAKYRFTKDEIKNICKDKGCRYFPEKLNVFEKCSECKEIKVDKERFLLFVKEYFDISTYGDHYKKLYGLRCSLAQLVISVPAASLSELFCNPVLKLCEMKNLCFWFGINKVFIYTSRQDYKMIPFSLYKITQ